MILHKQSQSGLKIKVPLVLLSCGVPPSGSVRIVVNEPSPAVIPNYRPSHAAAPSSSSLSTVVEKIGFTTLGCVYEFSTTTCRIRPEPIYSVR